MRIIGLEARIDSQARSGVQVTSTVPLLELRGGGPGSADDHYDSQEGNVDAGAQAADSGAGVRRWLFDDDPNEGPAPRPAERRGHVTIDLFSALGFDGNRECEQVNPFNAAGHAPPRVPTITGSRNGKPVQTCLLCFRDWDLDDARWSRCVCGRARCPQCEGRHCPCGEPGRYDGAARTIAVNSSTDQGAQEEQWDDPALRDRLAEAADAWEEPVAGWAGADGCPAMAATDCCGNCGLSIRTPNAEWRICSCTTWYCTNCAGGPCHSCGARIVWAESYAMSEGSQTASLEVIDDGISVDAERIRAPGDWQTAGRLAPTPKQLAEWRRSKVEERREAQRASKIKWRRMRDDQIRQGLRPRRDRGKDGKVVIISSNITAAESLKEELLHGEEIQACDYLLAQEHALQGEQRARAMRWAEGRGWDPVIHEAYTKNAKPGGGTLILGRGQHGVSDGGEPAPGFEGRMSLGTGYVDGEVTLASVYCISGAAPKAQIPIIGELVDRLKIRARPFNVGGDGQMTPNEMRALGIDKALGAVICAPRVPTNVHSRRTIDFFLVSESIA